MKNSLLLVRSQHMDNGNNIDQTYSMLLPLSHKMNKAVDLAMKFMSSNEVMRVLIKTTYDID